MYVTAILDCDAPHIPADVREVTMEAAKAFINAMRWEIQRVVEVSDNVVTIFYGSTLVGSNITFFTSEREI